MKKLFTDCIEEALFLILFLVVYGSAIFFSVAYAGGGDETIDPRNGCYEKVGYSGEEIKAQSLDYLTSKGKYARIIDRDRYNIFKRCWEGKANCIRIATVCRKDGDVVYDGFDWLWRAK